MAAAASLLPPEPRGDGDPLDQRRIQWLGPTPRSREHLGADGRNRSQNQVVRHRRQVAPLDRERVGGPTSGRDG